MKTKQEIREKIEQIKEENKNRNRKINKLIKKIEAYQEKFEIYPICEKGNNLYLLDKIESLKKTINSDLNSIKEELYTI